MVIIDCFLCHLSALFCSSLTLKIIRKDLESLLLLLLLFK